MTGAPRSHGRLAVQPSTRPRDLMRAAPVGGWRVSALTIFPELFPGPLAESLTGKALREGVWTLETLDIRRFATDKHRSVDGPPAGGGPGMVMRPDVVAAALDAAGDEDHQDARPRLYLSPRGRRFDQARARALAAGAGAVLLCGRFEGVDQRALDARGVEEVSVGDFVLTGGEIPAMAVIDACVRLLPGVLGNAASLTEESFSAGLLEAPHYTRPRIWEGRGTPETLLSGDHARIAAWRRARATELTKERRPDLWRAQAAQAASGSPAEAPELSDAHISADQGGQQKD